MVAVKESDGMDLRSAAAQRRAALGRPGTWDGDAWKSAFHMALESKPWAVGYASCNADDLRVPALNVEGEVPQGIRGTFFRNGPGRHERGSQRYGHRWDGDGLVQAFRFSDDGISFQGRYVRTSKFVAESAADRFLVSAFGTCIPGAPFLTQNIDEMNSANISVCMAGDDLLALWEPGSAYRLDPHTLETLGIKTWHPELNGHAFSAHPKREPDGTLWNFGADPLKGELTIYCIGSEGVLKAWQVLQVDHLPTLHDFAVTQRHLVFVLSPLIVSAEKLQNGLSFAQACEWTPRLGTRVLVVDKLDFSRRWYELPASCVFHTANAWEDAFGGIRLDFMAAANPVSLVAGWAVMRGEYQHRPGAFFNSVFLSPTGAVEQTVLDDLEGEFPVVDAAAVGQRHREVICIARSPSRDSSVPGYDELVSCGSEDGSIARYSYGPDWLVEEHVLIPDTRRHGPAPWVVGTALNLRERCTVLSVFRADAISEGPVAQGRLPFALPLGLHGCFTGTRD
jgi:all-trans-8'-apo-beta-carotenal 15,15'-oxygenase